jgi:hypothetical protein
VSKWALVGVENLKIFTPKLVNGKRIVAPTAKTESPTKIFEGALARKKKKWVLTE